jgi:uncharacterized protein YkuJ
MTTIPLGAINKKTGEYVYPRIANKIDEYSCPECHKDLIICQGNIRVHHFRHKVDSTEQCHHYNAPTESQIHKDAKLLLKTILEKNTKISFIRNCCCCKTQEEFEIPSITHTTDIRLEHGFEYNGTKIADVAYIDNGEIICIFEICHTHKTKTENRPEPWFEIDALSFIQNMNDINLSGIQVPCIRCEKCDECIQKDNLNDQERVNDFFQSVINETKINIERKSQALDILYDWFQSGIEIPPFLYDYANFAGVEKNVRCDFIDEIFDLILYVDPIEKYERYCIRLINGERSSKYYFTKEERYADNIISLYYIKIDWILSQTEIPQHINYIASLDFYDKHNHYDTKCSNCKHTHPIWVKRINLLTDYTIINIGGGCCDKNPISDTKYINCERCNSVNTPLCVMETNKISKYICKSCDIDLYSSGNVYLHVPFSEKDEARTRGAIWDNKYRKWFIHKNHKNIDIILTKWKRLW